MKRIDLEKSLRSLAKHSQDITWVTTYLRMLGAETFRRMMSSSGDEQTAFAVELKTIQKILDVIDNNQDPSLIRA